MWNGTKMAQRWEKMGEKWEKNEVPIFQISIFPEVNDLSHSSRCKNQLTALTGGRMGIFATHRHSLPRAMGHVIIGGLSSTPCIRMSTKTTRPQRLPKAVATLVHQPMPRGNRVGENSPLHIALAVRSTGPHPHFFLLRDTPYVGIIVVFWDLARALCKRETERERERR